MRHTKIKHYCILFISNPLGQRIPSPTKKTTWNLLFWQKMGKGRQHKRTLKPPQDFPAGLRLASTCFSVWCYLHTE